LIPPVVEFPKSRLPFVIVTKVCDVLFCGYINSRRESILNELTRAGYNVLHVTNVFGTSLTKLISQSRIFLNIHHSNSKSLETCRLNEAVMSTDTHIISERGNCEELYEGRVIFVEKEDILKTVKEVLNKSTNVDYVSELNLYKLKHLTESKIFNTLSIEHENKKILHRYNCYSNLPFIRNIIIPDINQGCINETVLLEFRQLPHLEFLIRNTIIKLPNWSHTVVCGNLNYVFIQNICNSISNKIKVIILDIGNLTPSEYSKLLLKKDFWLNLSGEKILIYQEDTMLFHNRIDEFLNYDYVGASWPVDQDDNSYGVGNGGFSLRTKTKMIECIEKVNPNELKLGQSTLSYMKSTNSYHIPEDVFFSKSLIDYNIGSVSTRDVANRFSQETQLCNNPLGGHNFWLANGNELNVEYKITLETEYYKTVEHRGGWKSIIYSLLENNVVKINDSKSKNIIKFIDCVESRFIWDKNVKPIIEHWIGVIHYSSSLPKFLIHTLDLVINNDTLLKSLKFCKGLIVLSKNSLNVIKKHDKYKNINIINIKHPSEPIMGKFSLERFIKNKTYSIIQLGLQDRKVTTIYTLHTNYNKVWMPGTTVTNNYINRLRLEEDYLDIKVNDSDVSIKYFININEFDNILQNNIIIIPLWSSSANNSVMEIIEMNIPAFVTRLPATEEYLGKDYPMFFKENSDIENIINDINKLHDIVKRTYSYLLNMNKSEISIKFFKSELCKFILMS